MASKKCGTSSSRAIVRSAALVWPPTKRTSGLGATSLKPATTSKCVHNFREGLLLCRRASSLERDTHQHPSPLARGGLLPPTVGLGTGRTVVPLPGVPKRWPRASRHPALGGSGTSTRTCRRANSCRELGGTREVQGDLQPHAPSAIAHGKSRGSGLKRSVGPRHRSTAL